MSDILLLSIIKMESLKRSTYTVMVVILVLLGLFLLAGVCTACSKRQVQGLLEAPVSSSATAAVSHPASW